MLLFAAALLLQVLPGAGAAVPDTLAFDSPATRQLVERVIRETWQIPEELQDYEATVRTQMSLAMAPDSAIGGELPITIDDFVSDVRWRQDGVLHQIIRAHRTRVIVPAPYTLGTLMESPWVIPHLYGPTIEVLTLSPDGSPRGDGLARAVHPFGEQGPLHYRYSAGDTLRIFLQGERVTLVPITVTPRIGAAESPQQLVVGSFFIDVDRAAVAQARFGFVERRRGVFRTRTGTFLELENGLWEGRFWLPFRQRRELQIGSPLFGGAVGARIVNTFSGYRINSGWTPPPGTGRWRLFYARTMDADAFAGEEPVGAGAGEFDIADFADLRRLAIEAAEPTPRAVRFGFRFERGDHLFRYNRVEGPFLGLAARIEPGDPLERRWEVYATGGWAFAEGTPRGEVIARWHMDVPRVPPRGIQRGVLAGVYRRLPDLRSFQPTYRWDWLTALPAAFGGTDRRDYYDATGVELRFIEGRLPWRGWVGGRWERQDSVRINTQRYLFGTADNFPPLASIEPGTHAALEAEVGYARGPGAYGMANSAVASLRGEVGLGDFRTQRLTGLLSLRHNLEPVTLAGRLDVGHAFGEPPPQMLFRFGEEEGLRGYARNEFGGSTVALGRGRVLLGLPPRTAQPLARFGPFMIPPMRPSLVLLGETGWATVTERSRPQLERLGAAPTDGLRTSAGAGLSFFDDALTVEWIRPLEDDRRGRWYIGLVQWF